MTERRGLDFPPPDEYNSVGSETQIATVPSRQRFSETVLRRFGFLIPGSRRGVFGYDVPRIPAHTSSHRLLSKYAALRGCSQYAVRSVYYDLGEGKQISTNRMPTLCVP